MRRREDREGRTCKLKPFAVDTRVLLLSKPLLALEDNQLLSNSLKVTLNIWRYHFPSSSGSPMLRVPGAQSRHLPCTVAMCFKPSPAAYPLCTLLIHCLEHQNEALLASKPSPNRAQIPLQGEKGLLNLRMLLKSMQRH